MSTLSGVASKGEKAKLKYQSLDINNLYRASRGESSEKQQQKSTPTFKYGMQSLGRVPSARRPPANLPSIKSEHSGTDAAVSLVPSGGPGWGKQDSTTPSSTSTTPPTTSTTTNCNANSPSPANIPLSAHQAAIALPVTTTIPPPVKHNALPVTSAATDKSWSSVMTGSDMLHPPPYQSPQFQHEFPSLSAGDGGQARSVTDTQYGPGPSLRPQTEGSWMQGGSRANSDPLPRSNSAPLGAPPQLSAQVGLTHQPLPPQYHGILPNFMFRGNTPANGHGTSTAANIPPIIINNNRGRVETRPPSIQRASDADEVARRPIIKEEDLNRMDDMTKDMGWAAQDEIDYNQKLEFSDDEALPDKNMLKHVMKLVPKEADNKDRQEKTDSYQDDSKNWNRNGNNGSGGYSRGRGTDEDEILALKRRQQHQVVTNAAERAKQRKEEEEKKYLEAKLKNKRDKDQDDGQGTISPSNVPPQPITPAPIPVPDWEKEKDNVKSDVGDENRNAPMKSSRDSGSDFRQMAQIEAKNFVRKDNRNVDRGNSGYRQMQNLPPRLQKKQQPRNNTSPQPPISYAQYDPMRYSNEDIRRGMSNRPYSDMGRKSSQSPDSRDSRTSRDSRHSRESIRDSEPREHLGSWAESIAYEERKKDVKEDRRQVPGPITKEKIEADEKQNEKRNLTQLKKGAIPPPVSDRKNESATEKPQEKDSNLWGSQNKDNGTLTHDDISKPWTDDVSTSATGQETSKQTEGDVSKKNVTSSELITPEIKEEIDLKKPESNAEGNKEKEEKKSHPPSRNRSENMRSQGWERNTMCRSWYKKSKGEPSKLLRSGGSMKDRDRGGLSRRIDGYGPPPKSPFGHTIEKDKKNPEDPFIVNNPETLMDKSKLNSAGVIGSAKKEPSSLPSNPPRIEKKYDDKYDRGKPRRNPDSRKPRPPKMKDENGDTSEHSDDSINKQNRKSNKSPLRSRSSNVISRRNQPPRLSDKRPGNFSQSRSDYITAKQNSSGSLRSGSISNKKENNVVKDEKPTDVSSNSLCNAIADITLKNKEQSDEQESIEVEVDEKNSGHGDSDGFQEVKSKKTVKDRQKVTEEKPVPKPPIIGKPDPIVKPDRKGKPMTPQLSQQQIASIPSLMDTPINPPSVIPQPSNKNTYDRCRNNKLPPRLAKQREQGRLQKVQMHQHNMCDVNDINKVNQNIGLYGLKDNSSSMQITNAWDKPIQLRSNMESDSVLSIGIENCKSMDQPHSPGQNNNSPNAEKVIGKGDRNQIQDKSVLDGTTPPVNTIIFENTNYKSTPGVRNNRNEKARSNKIEDSSSNIETSVMSGFNKPISDLLNKNDKTDIQMQLFNKEECADMKLDFFESDISHLTDDKSSKNLSLPKSMHAITSSNSTISPSTADLNFKIASVKKVWDNTMMPPVLEHNIGQEDNSSSFSTSFGPDPNSLDASSAFSKGTDTSDDAHEGYSSSPNQNVPNSTTNVCKVKPTQQVPGTTGQNVGAHQQLSGIISSGLIAPLSSPPIQPVIGPNVGLNQAPQQYTTNQHIGYQTGLGGSNQYGIPAIPSPPVVYNSTQQLQQQAGLYGGFPIDQLGGQRTSQFSQYANPYNLGQTASSPYSAQSLYLPTAQPHAPPTAQAPPDLYQSINNYRIPNTAPYGQPHAPPTAQAPPDLYQSINNYRIPNTAPYGQNQQLNNPTTVLISSTSNSLMSASVKPSSQPISAIGGQTGYFQQPGNSTLQSGPLQQHQASYGLQGNVFGTHNQSHTSAGLQNLNSHFLSQMQFAMNVQQYRSQNLQSTSYLKSISNQQVGDQTGRSQQLKSPGTQQEVLSSVFNSGPGPQIPSPKSRQNCKQPPPQPSPTTQYKYNLYQSVGNQQTSQTQRYPQPIQRPTVNFQHNLGSIPNNGSNNHKHRTNNNANKGPTRQYYSPQGGGLSSQNDKTDDSKLVDSVTPNTGNSTNANSASIVNKTAAIGSVTNATINKTEIAKDKDESSVIKD